MNTTSGGRVHVLACGGTIAAGQAAVGGYAPVFGGEALIERARVLGPLPRVEVSDFCLIPGEHMTPQVWKMLAERVRELVEETDVCGVVITHGTDTLEETAFFLDATIPGGKPVVVTGAQRPFSDHDSDGARNVRDALHVASHPGFRGAGVLVVFDGQIHAAQFATKVHTMATRAFDSGEWGPVGTVDHDRVHVSHVPTRKWLFERLALEHRVDMIPVYPGGDGQLIEAALGCGISGLVVIGLGRGNVNPPTHEAVNKVIGAGVPVVMTTRVPRGPVVPAYGYVGGGVALARSGVIFAGYLSPQKARILLMLALANGVRNGQLEDLFNSFFGCTHLVSAPT